MVVADSDTVARLRPVLLCARVRPAREVPSSLELLTVKLPDDEVIAVHEMTPLPKTNFVTLRGRLSEPLLEELKVALRARFDL
ncbi:hypothetical protein GCM10010198_68160 [Nocardia seriolae]|nr:hypothetical protein NSERKGN1266_31030 [Nocardia seriolae]BEK97080.1 hypothetical protein NSER024013_49860 [Nocardia seriolae]GEM27058.1 hypothetical protein NS2_52970 [Nocardia seriolae NBRC 15557]